MLIEVLVRVNGEDKYVDFRKLFDYIMKDKYDGKKIEPCPDRVTKFKEERDYFDLFWINYPKKTSKKDAWNFWKKNFKKLPIKEKTIKIADVIAPKVKQKVKAIFEIDEKIYKQ